ncbi:alpha/beta fold hydrolase [Microbacteriaceae bacterium K1510]|nr:alpha/beta fold hydrolase [Microbacteriaceae bacterium K1510]
MSTTTTDMPMAAHIAGAGDDVVLIHGGRGSHTHWVRNIGPLARHYRVIALDLPGFGDSPDVARDIDADGYLALVVNGVRRLAGERPVSIVGFSFGGAVSAHVARQLGDQCRKLALLGPGGFGEAKGRILDLRPAPKAIETDPRYRAVIRHNLLAMMLHDPASVTEDTVDIQCRNIARGRFNSLKVSLRPTLIPDLAAMSCPLAMVWGANDAVAYPSPQARAADCQAARPDLELTIVHGAGHWVQYEAADAVNALLLDFLRRD